MAKSKKKGDKKKEDKMTNKNTRSSARKGANKYGHKAKKNKADEWITFRSDIEKELKHYKKHFKNKIVLCNCDDPRISGFFHYFSYNFEHLGLKKLITTCYKNQQMELFSENKSEKAIYLEYTGDKNNNKIPDPEEIGIKNLTGDGDFRSKECIELLKEADIVVTNPPFSLYREYISQLAQYKKKFLIIGQLDVISYKEVFRLLQDDKIWVGINRNRDFKGFIIPKHYPLHGTEAFTDEDGNRVAKSNKNLWLTNLDNVTRHEELILYKKYKKSEYPTYENYDAIEVSQVKNIPIDYEGLMGVPISFVHKYNPKQFEIVWTTDRGGDGMLENYKKKHARFDAPVVISDGKEVGLYTRILIRHKKT